MLNELNQLADALDKAGITLRDWHPRLQSLPNVSDKRPCFRIYIAEDGSISLIDELNRDLATILRKWEPNLGNSFPGFNIQPLYRITGDEQKKMLKVWRDGKERVDIKILKSWCSELNNNWNEKAIAKISKCLTEIPESLLSIINASGQSSASSLTTLIGRIIKIHLDEFRKALEKYLWNEIENRSSVNTALSILIYEGNSSKVKKEDIDKDRGALSVFLDITDYDEYPVAHQNTIDWLNDRLIAVRSSGNSSCFFDAFGEEMTGSEEKLPVIKLPVLGKVGLRSMNHESVCQYRYGTIDSISFPIGYNSRKRTKSALEWLAPLDESRKGETWGKIDAKELLFAYPSILPVVPVKFTTLFGAHKTDDSEARFADAAKAAIDALTKLSTDLRKLDLRVFSLKKMDTTSAKTKVVFHRNYNAQRLVDAAKDWQIGCTNIPVIALKVWGEDKKPSIANPIVPFPLQISNCLNRVWKMNGEFIKTKNGDDKPVIASTIGIELLLEEQSERFSPHLLSILIKNSKGLLLFMGNQRLQSDDKGREYVFPVSNKNKYENHKLLIPSILGLLLYKLGYAKEDYMNSTPFLVGRMLKLADDLHALYCTEVRDNKLPPQLIGNTLMTAALDSPIQALAQLALRLKPYYGWAQTFQKGNNAKLAGYFIGLYADTASQLATLELPQRFNDPERAQVLLGYLSANPKKSDKNNEVSNNESTDSNNGE